MKRKIKVLSVLLFSCFGVFAQNNIDLNALPNVEDYIVTNTNPSADTVIVGLHGGPTSVLYPGDFDYFNNISTFSVVEMKQIQHLHPAIMQNSSLTLEDAIIYNDTTVALLKKVVDHFNNLDKKVVLMGHSFGAFLLTEYLDDYGIDDVHRIIPMAGRLNMNQEVVDAFENGYSANFENGITVEIDPDQAPASELAGMKLQAGVGYNRQVDSLAGLNLSKLMYVYGTHDQAVGRLLPEETTMLENGNATIVAVENGNHDSPFFVPQMVQILNFIRTAQTAGLNNVSAEELGLKVYPTLTHDIVNLECKTDGVLKITNINGQLVFENSYVQGKHVVDAAKFPKGYYLATFINNNNEVATTKLIVQ